MNNTVFSSLSFKLLTILAVLALALGSAPVIPVYAAAAPLNAWTSISSSNPGGNSGTVNAGNLTVSPGSNRLFVVAACYELSAANTMSSISASLGSTDLTPIGSTGGTSAQEHCYMGYLLESQIPAGSNLLSIDYNVSGIIFPAITGMHVSWASFSGVNQTTPINDSNASTNGAANVTFGSQIDFLQDGLTIYAAGNINTPVTMTAPSGFTQQLGATGNGHSSFVASITTAPHAANGNFATGTSVAFPGGGARSSLVVASLRPAIFSTATGVATAAASGATNISVSMPYTNDQDADNTYTVEYCLTSSNCSASGAWITWVSGAAHTASPYTSTILGLTTGTSYDVRVTYIDADGVTGTNPQIITGITPTAPACGTSYTYSAPAGSDRVVVVFVSTEDNVSPTNVQIGGVAATGIATVVNGNARLYAGYRVIGTSAVPQAMNITATNGDCFYANTYQNINQTTGNGTANTINSIATGTAGSGTTTTSANVFNAAGGAVVNAAGGRVLYGINMNNGSANNQVATGTSAAWTFTELFDRYEGGNGNRTAVGNSSTTTAGSGTISVGDGGVAHNRSVLVAFALNASNSAPTVSTPITDVNVLEDAANTVFSLYPNFADAQSTDAQLTYTVTGNTNAALFTSVNISDPTNFTLDYAPDAHGTASLTVRATDPGGLFVEDTFTVTVTTVNDAPSFTMGADQSVNEDAGAQTVAGWAASVLAGPADEAAQTLTFTVTNDNNALFSAPPVIAPNGTLTYTPAANANGTANVTVVSLQDNGGTANGGVDTFTPVSNTFTITINPVNDAPVCTNVAITTDEDTSGNTAPNCSDIDGDTLTYNAVDNAANGTGSFVNPDLTYVPDANFNGVDSFSYTANDGTVDSAAAAVNVTVNALNDAPVCSDVAIVTNEDTTGTTLPNCIDVDGDTLTYSVVDSAANGTGSLVDPDLTYTPDANFNGADSFTYTANDGTVDSNAAAVNVTVNAVNDAPICSNVFIVTDEDTAGTTLPNCSDIDGDTLTYTAIDTAANGTGSFVDPNLTYEPDGNFNGIDSFSYTANDGTVDSNAATVNVTINSLNDAPVCSDVSINTSEDTTGTTLPNCSDVDGDALTYAAVDSAANGSGSFVDPDLVYVPDANFNGADSFTYTANDGTADSASATVNVTINAVNDAPVCSDVSINTNEDTTGTTLPNCSDVDGDTLTYTANNTATNGTGSFIDPDLTYVPNSNFNGSDSFTYTANDGNVDSNVATINVTVGGVNDAPVCSNVSIITNEDTTGTALPNCTDPDGDPLTYTASNTAANGTGSFVDPDLIYTPDADFNGTDSFTYTANDGTVNSNNAAVNVTVNAVNDAPVCNDVSINTSEDTTGTTLPDCTDVDGDALTYSAINSATDGTGSFVDPDLTYTPDVNFNGSDSFTYTANDGTVDSNVAAVNVTVSGTNDAPTDILLSNASIVENNAINDVIGVLSATDIDAGDTFTFALACSTPGANDGSFNINGANLRASAAFDYETQNNYSICIRVRDQGGTGLTFDQNFTITIADLDEDPPQTVINSNPSDPTNGASASFTFSGDDNSGSGVAGFECSLDGGAFTACTTPQTYPGLSDGNHTFEVRALDNAGNTDPSPASFTWLVDTTAPDTSIDSNPADPTNSTSAAFTFSGTDGGTGVAGFECQLNGSGFNSCSSPATFNSLADGSHTFEVRALDALGNTDLTPATFTWVVDTTSPETTIDATPANPSSDADPGFDFSGDDGSGSGIASFECQVDGGGFSACTSGSSFGPLADGSHTFEVRAIDDAGNTDSTPASYTWVVDVTDPDTSITSNPNDPSAVDAAAFSFTGTDSGVGVAGFECQLDGSGFTACSSAQNYSGLGDGSHTFEVRAIDNVGNIDATPASFTWLIDTTTPDTTIDSTPSDPDNDSTPSFTFSGVDGGSGVASFECQVDGGGFNACSSGDVFGPLSDGSHTFEVRAVDSTGNADLTPASYLWAIDTTTPDTTITGNPSDPSTDNTPDFSFTGSDGGSGLASFECQIDGGGFSACNSGDTFGPLSDGSHTFEVRAVDNAGNPDPKPAAFNWVVDTTAPDTTIDDNPSDPDNDANPVFEFSSNDGTAVFECQVDGGGYTACTSGSSFGPLSDGSHTFDVRAVDTLGNTDATPASYTWTIDTGTPETNIDSHPIDPSMIADAAFDFSSPDSDVVGFECSLDGAAFTSCTSPQNYTGLSAGSHTFEVRAVDNSNNADPSPASFTWMVDLGYPIKSGSTPANNAVISTGPKKLIVRFNEDVKNDGSAGAANNVANYLLVENGANTTFETVDCASGLAADDTQITIDAVTYTNNGGSGPFVATLTINGGAALPLGKYRLFICGTTSIEDLAGNELNNGLSDATVSFTVSQSGGNNGGNNGGSNGGNNSGQGNAAGSGFIIPVTGFPRNQATTLPVQPAELAYAATDFWLEIPSLGVKMTIVGVPSKDGNWDVKWLNKDAGWLHGSAYPTWSGNSVLTGHVWDALNQPGPFANLKKLKFGDQVRIHAAGQIYIYEVRESEAITPTDTAAVFKHQEKSWLTLVTCENYNESSQTYLSRRMVRAVLVSVIAEK